MDSENKKEDKMAALEEMASQALLIELFNAKQTEVFENVVFEGKRRYYIEDLSDRDYNLENTTPYQIEILGNVIEENSWGNLLCKVSNLLLSMRTEYAEKMVSFRSAWSKAEVFALQQKTNYKPISHNLFLNCNHTALHSCWLLQDILDYFEIERSTVHFLIHRPCSAEPIKVKEYIEKRFKRGFIEYLIIYHNRSEEQANKIIYIIEKYLNPMLVKISKSYTNLFLFDDNAIMSNYIKKIREQIAISIHLDERARIVLNKYLDLLVKYYRQ